MKKEILPVNIIENQNIAENIWRMRIKYNAGNTGQKEKIEAAPGQFVNLYLNRKDLLLPRPISICRAEDETLTLVYAVVGKGTEEMSSYREGTLLHVSTPLGNGFPFENEWRDSSNINEEERTFLNAKNRVTALVIGGGLGVPPLLELAYRLSEYGMKVDAVLGFREEPFMINEFEKAGVQVHIATESGHSGFRGLVTDLMLEKKLFADRYFACGPKPMLKAVTLICKERNQEIAVSLEERMGCGYGACLGCTCKIKGVDGLSNKRVCKDGPVFWGSEVDWDA